MTWKKNLNDPQYLMEMRRPTFIVSRAVGLSAQRLIGTQPRWLFIDMMQTIKELIATRPGIPNITLPSDLSEKIDIGDVIGQPLTAAPAGKKKQPSFNKRISRKLRKLFG